MQVGILGLGKMGRLIAEKLMRDGHQVVVWNRTRETVEQFRVDKAEFILNQKLVISHSIEELRTTLRKPRVIWSMLPAGEATETTLKEIGNIVEAGDIVIDGGNAFFKDTDRRFEEFKGKGVKYLGIGVSGGIHAQENGASLMVGGDKEGYDYIIPLLDSLAKPNGAHTYFGTGGAGHFVKMIHNGVEYGMMQALGEGLGVLAKSAYNVNMVDVLNTWQRGSIVSSFLTQMAADALSKDPGLSKFDGAIDATGEGKWTVDAAKEAHVPIYVIEQSLQFRDRSQYDKTTQDTFAAKLVAALRKEFGGHEPKKPPEQPPKK